MITVTTYNYTIKMFMKDGSIETIEKESWLSPQQIELGCREAYDNDPDEVLIDKMEITWEEN
ncbi:hypothetical protein BMBphi_gp006 [Bacillus phage vB_BthS_BMBphi]|nr:hypothetical protein BMBphi_gp006 [Bacillus phage vB_BthS_BMBphi]